MQTLPSELSEYYRLTTYERAMGDFFSPIWKSRMLTDTRGHRCKNPVASREDRIASVAHA
jgi:hypothetical protein